jgi:hypothetical protein
MIYLQHPGGRLLTSSSNAVSAYREFGFVEITNVMTVGQLIEQLQNFDPSMRVIVPFPLATVVFDNNYSGTNKLILWI